jgi:hypothetical protein
MLEENQSILGWQKAFNRAEIDLAKQVAIYQELKRAINGGAGNGAVELASLFQQLVSIKMVVCGKSRLDNDVPLLGAAEALGDEVSF